MIIEKIRKERIKDFIHEINIADLHDLISSPELFEINVVLMQYKIPLKVRQKLFKSFYHFLVQLID